MDTLGERISFLRDNLEMTQMELAEKIGITPMTLAKYTKDLNEPRSGIIAKMARVLHTTSDYIIGLTDDASPSGAEPALPQSKREQELVFRFRKLSETDKIRIEERILTLLEEQDTSNS